jgi:phospholipid/cholesterol/gamma-HCH transport system ATP-binding protein
VNAPPGGGVRGDGPLTAPPGRGDGPVVAVRGLVSRFGDNLVHDGLDLEVQRGDVLGLVGGSGSGKSVLLDTLIGLRRPDGGTVQVLGVDLAHASEADQRGLERRWGVLFQGGALFSALSVHDNVCAPLFEHARLPRRQIDELAELKLALAGLPAEAGRLKPAELSGGMRKRVALARALALDPELLFLDEPTAGLDPIGADAFDRLIRELSQALGLTVVMITHDLDSLYALCNRVAVIADRRIVAEGPLAELERSQHPWVRQYFLGPRGRAARGAAATAEVS